MSDPEATHLPHAVATRYAIRPKSPAEQPAPADFGAATDPAALDARFAKLEQTVSEQSTLIQALNSRVDQLAGAADDSKIAGILAEADGQIAALKALQDVVLGKGKSAG